MFYFHGHTYALSEEVFNIVKVMNGEVRIVTPQDDLNKTISKTYKVLIKRNIKKERYHLENTVNTITFYIHTYIVI